MESMVPAGNPIRWLGQQLFNRQNPAVFFDPLLEVVNPLWVRRYLPAQVIGITEETHDIRTFELRPASRWGGFRPGQHLNLNVEIDGRWYARPFTLSCAPQQWRRRGTITLTVKKVPDGVVTGWMHDRMAVGDVVGITEAFGDEPNPRPDEPALFIAGGSGITPALSQLSAMSEQGRDAPVTLLYFVRTEKDVIRRETLEHLQQQLPQLTLKVVVSEPAGRVPEYLNEDHLRQIEGLGHHECFVCGPPGMMRAAGELLESSGVSPDQIHRTFFVAATPADGGDAEAGGTVTFARSSHEVLVEDGRSLLEVAEEAGLNPRYGCRMGICHQCSCRKSSGVVMNRLTGRASSPGEETIQLCISSPRGPVSLDL